MAEKITAEARESFGKGAARKLRAAGRIPAVVYGHGTEPVHISLPAHETGLVLRRANAVLELEVTGATQLALVKDVQRDPVRQIIEHLDLILVRQGETVEVEIPVQLEGESAPGTVATLESATLLLDVEATHIPQHVVVSIEGATEGTQIAASDVTLPEGAKLASDPELLIVVVANERGEEALENAAEGAPTDVPEVPEAPAAS